MIKCPDIFKNLDYWQKFKNITLFKNQLELQTYQSYYLKKILYNKKKYSHFELMTSGTTSNIIRRYSFPKELFWIIDNHHMWRIFQSHKIKSGNCIKIFQIGKLNKNDNFTGPKIDSCMGIENNTWNLYFNPYRSNHSFWKKIFKQIKNIKPNFLYTSPSVFDSFYNFLLEENLKFNFPIIFSCETLFDRTKNNANIFFSKSIDKMKDWSTGFGFYECSHKTKHIYDDLCICEQKEGDRISCTDLFNYNEKFINVISDDLGIIKKIKCDCGVYGNILEKFQGKVFECLISIKGKKYSSNFISNLLSNFTTMEYEIVQKKDKSIDFIIKNKISDEDAIEIGKAINYIIMDDGNNLSVINENKTVFFSDSSNIFLKFKEKDRTIYNNKIISVRSFVEN